MRTTAANAPLEVLESAGETSDSVPATEEALVRAAQAGDAAAFQQLYASHRRSVRGVVLAHVGWVDADDLTQDVFLVAWQRLDQLRDLARFGPWLLQCARNRCRDHHRRGRKLEPTSEANTPAVSMPPRAEALEVFAAIQRLAPHYRETLSMRLIEGMSGPEIAAHTGLTPRSVRVNLHRGMNKLRALLGEDPRGAAK